jgi:ABC-type antimicrobial peptide transport system permease subunit
MVTSGIMGIVGLIFSIFAGLLLYNYISLSITQKIKEIGILRAWGSGKKDIILIFFSESFIISLINSFIACFGTFLLTIIVNRILKSEYHSLLTMLSFVLIQITFIFMISLFVAFLSSLLPIIRLMKKKPIDIIKSI